MSSIGRKDFRCLAWLGALLLLQFAPVVLTGRGYFLRDLTYINQPWRALAAQELQAGRLPLWNPYAYLGLPLAANMQSGVLYPLSSPFHLLGFAAALKLFHLVHFGLAGLLVFLWLRSWRLERSGAAAAAAVFMLGGPVLCRLEFLNLLAVLALAPALLLFARRPLPLALALALGFLAGHPQSFAALAAVGFCLSPGRAWLGAAGLSAPASACLAFPAAEMIAQSARSGGVEAAVALARSLSFSDLPGLLSPLFTPADPGGARFEWWRALYLGFAGAAAVGLGVRRLRGRALVPLGLSAAALLLCLGASFGPSAWLWTHSPLRFLRYPANLGFLIPLPLLPLLAAGLTTRTKDEGRRTKVMALLVGFELLAYGWKTQPTQAGSYWTDKGANVEALQAALDGHRFFLSPRAAAEQRGVGRSDEQAFLDLRHRLQGLSFLPFRIAAAGGDGEPLVPAGALAALDYARSRASAEAALPVLAWLDVKTLLRPGPVAEDPRWQAVAVPRAGGAFFLPAGAGLPPSFEGVAFPRNPVERRAPRPDSEALDGAAPVAGLVVLSRTDYPGWRYWVNGEPAAPLRAFGTLPALIVPRGPWELRARYRPASAGAGMALSLLSLIAAGVNLYNRTRRSVRAF